MAGYALTDTIVALGSPPGQSALAILRLSGARSWSIIKELCEPAPQLSTQHVQLVTLKLVHNTEVLKETAVVIPWQAPHSYTGEDMIELTLHGNPLLVTHVRDACVSLDARPAEAGEFTFRAVINGKLDLAQAEAVQELISASGYSALRLASSSLAGLPSAKATSWVEQLTHLLAGIEVIHDYAADDLDANLDRDTLLTHERLASHLAELIEQFAQALATAQRTIPIRDGISVAICGPPNVGKSTLFNALLGYERALTAPEPGTTRDYLTATLNTGHLSLTLVDTAGSREALDGVEAAGVRLASDWASQADRVLWVLAADRVDHTPPPSTGTAEHINVVTRCDLLPTWPSSTAQAYFVSGVSGRGVPELWQHLCQVDSSLLEAGSYAFTTRQAARIKSAHDELQQACDALSANLPFDVVATHLYGARQALSGIYQQADHNQVITEIFSGFCVGK